MDYLPILVLALVQGAAELLPVSSSAHVILAAKGMGADPSTPEFVFLLMMLHTGTMFAVLVYFWPRWKRLLWQPHAEPGIESGPTVGRFLQGVIVATVCTGVLGFGLKVLIEKVVFERLMGRPEGQVEDLFKNLYLIGAGLLAAGILILIAGLHETKSVARTISTPWAIGIGLVQGLCLPFRGFSRSGATISTALLQGMARPLAEDFSFALAVVLTPPLVVYELNKVRHKTADVSALIHSHILPSLVGMVFSFIAGLVALRLLSAVLEKGRWRYFGYYCIAASALVFWAASRGF